MFNCSTLVKRLCRILERRRRPLETERETIFSLSEDTICLFLAAALVEEGYEPHLIEMEFLHPHEELKKSETKVDVGVRKPDEPLWFEVKFDKRRPTASRFGLLLRDLIRVGLIEKGRRFVLYVYASEKGSSKASDEYVVWLAKPPVKVDREMLHQFSETVRNGVDRMLELLEGGRIDLTLCVKIEAPPFECFLYEVSGRR